MSEKVHWETEMKSIGVSEGKTDLKVHYATLLWAVNKQKTVLDARNSSLQELT